MVDIDNLLKNISREQEEVHASERAKQYNIGYINLIGYPLTKEILEIIPVDEATKFKIIPYLKIGNQLRVGVVSPNPEIDTYLEGIGKVIGLKPTQFLMSESSFQYSLTFYDKYAAEEMTKAITRQKEVTEETNYDIKDIKGAAELAKRASTTKLLDTLLIGAAKLNSSDIHLEPSEDEFLTRYRIDGVLQDIVRLPLLQYKQIISRIKFMSKLRMDMNDQPQDGRFSFMLPGDEEINFRVSIMPSAYGESLVLRLLGQEKTILKLDDLGFRPEALAVIKEEISKPHGMVLTSGPTGSGKSSTLYSILIELKKPGIKIITLEDPVEYKIEGIEQSQIKPGAGYEFADGLRASLRQDPDVLMVGEIRDGETAEIAVQAALTGHLLLSTIHANSAPAVFARFLEIGVQPFLLSGSINLIMAQRLVRKVCPFCKQTYTASPEVWQSILDIVASAKSRMPKEIIDKIDSNDMTLVEAKGCDKCSHTGFSGRQVIVEMITPDEHIESMIAKKATISEFEKIAADYGMITMEQDGMMKVLLGQTTVEEVWRVTKS
ncbi:MAG: GspE/PulE family protein [Candidatus Berkelbacteria bacterium]